MRSRWRAVWGEGAASRSSSMSLEPVTASWVTQCSPGLGTESGEGHWWCEPLAGSTDAHGDAGRPVGNKSAKGSTGHAGRPPRPQPAEGQEWLGGVPGGQAWEGARELDPSSTWNVGLGLHPVGDQDKQTSFPRSHPHSVADG